MKYEIVKFVDEEVKFDINLFPLEESVCTFFAHTANNGKIYNVRYYNFDVVISVGYSIKDLSEKISSINVLLNKL